MTKRVQVRRLYDAEGRQLQRIVRRGGKAHRSIVKWRRAMAVLASMVTRRISLSDVPANPSASGAVAKAELVFDDHHDPRSDRAQRSSPSAP